MQNIETCSCPLCGAEGVTPSHYDFSPYRVVQCVSCDFWYLSPRLTEAAMLAEYASDCYFSGGDGLDEGYSDYALQEKSLRPTFANFLAGMKRAGLTGGRLLEVGCGYGYLLDEAKPYFDYRAGTDFSQGAVERASCYADRVYLGGVDAIEENDRFDCIVAVEVLEHIYDPHQFMQKLYDKLVPGGVVVVAVPDMGSLWRKALQSKWPSFKMPEHVTYYDENTLQRLFDDNHFAAVEKIAFPHAFPLPEIMNKLKMSWLSVPRWNVWLPGVVLAMAARRPNGR